MDMWEEVRQIAESAGCTLTVYMDDLTLSGPRVPERVIWAVKRQIHRCGLRYHKEKRYSGGVTEITGVIVKDGELMLPNRQHRKLHALRKQLLAETDAEEVEYSKKKVNGGRTQFEQVVARNR